MYNSTLFRFLEFASKIGPFMFVYNPASSQIEKVENVCCVLEKQLVVKQLVNNVICICRVIKTSFFRQNLIFFPV